MQNRLLCTHYNHPNRMIPVSTNKIHSGPCCSKLTMLLHTCHISHCEIKSHRIWPIWKSIPIKKSNLTEFSDHFTTDLWRNKHKSHTVVVFTSFLHEKKEEDFRLYWGELVMIKKISQNFVKSPLKFCLISDFSPQLMACMWLVNVSLKLWSLNMVYMLIFCWKNVSSFCICKSYSHFLSKNTRELDIILTRAFNILITNELVKLTMLWTTGAKLT